MRVSWRSDEADGVLTAKEVRERMVHAGVVGPPPDEEGISLVGRRIRVYWPYQSERGYGEDRVFSGLVTHFDGESGEYCVMYDDGESVWEELGGSLAPRYCLEGWERVGWSSSRQRGSG